MVNAARETLINGLRNAHAMERQAEELMQRQIERTRDYPEMRARLREHLDETREQLTRLEKCLRHMDEATSSLKDTALAALGNLAALAHTSAHDEILKNTFADNAFEHYEIAAYKSLLTLCERAGVDFGPLLRQSLDEEEKMAAWIDDHIRQITLDYVDHRRHAA